MHLSSLAPMVVTALVIAALIIAGCSSPLTTNTPPASVNATGSSINATLDAYFAANYTIINHFTRTSEANETPSTYVGAFQDSNGTLHFLTLIVVPSTADAQRQFEDQKTNYADSAASPNATISANNSTHWSVVSTGCVINVWLVESKAAAPFSLTLEPPYVLVSVDTKPVLTSEVASGA